MSLLQEYYNGLYQEGLAKTANLYSQMRLTDAQAGEVQQNAEADRTLKGAQAGAAAAQAGLASAQAGQVAPNAAASRDLDASRAAQNAAVTAGIPGLNAADLGLKRAQIGLTTAQAGIAGYNVPGSNTGVFGLPTLDPTKPQGFEKGGVVQKGRPPNAIQGKGKPGPNDTVPVKMAPGEAVLNKGAVEHYGTTLIDRMNKMGLLRMGAQSELAGHLGLPDPHAAPGADKGGGSKGGGGKGSGDGKKAASEAGKGRAGDRSLPRLAAA